MSLRGMGELGDVSMDKKRLIRELEKEQLLWWRNRDGDRQWAVGNFCVPQEIWDKFKKKVRKDD